MHMYCATFTVDKKKHAAEGCSQSRSGVGAVRGNSIWKERLCVSLEIVV